MIDMTHQLSKLASEILRTELEFAAVKNAVTVTKKAKAMMTNMTQEMEGFPLIQKGIDLKEVNYHYECLEQRDKATVAEIIENRLTDVIKKCNQLHVSQPISLFASLHFVESG